MSQPIADDQWVLDEAEALLERDGLREKLEVIAADIQSGKAQLVDHKTARAQVEQVIRQRRTR
jgi:hypothetical protein